MNRASNKRQPRSHAADTPAVTSRPAFVRRFPIGAEVVPGSGTHFRVWAPARHRVEVKLHTVDRRPGATRPLQARGGYFEAFIEMAQPGDRYQFQLDGEPHLYPDPVSRCQPEGPHGPSELIDPGAFQWSDQDWQGVKLKGQVLYEMHVGTFTREGTFRSAIAELSSLKDLGITTVELMPLADFPGEFGWGYDGVSLFAPYHGYGRPDDLRTFVNEAHGLGLGVILDVVYNHLGPDGNYLKSFTQDYFTARHKNDWGEAINFDGENAHGVREFFLANAGYWIEEFHFDGLRLDATQDIHDQSTPHILVEIGEEARRRGRGKSILLVVENEPQDTRMIRPSIAGGHGLDAAWNDDFHHSAMVALTARADAYYTDYEARPQEFISALKWGYLYQGQRYKWQKARRGTHSLDLCPEQFVLFIQNHDQIANSAIGERCQRCKAACSNRTSPAHLNCANSTTRTLNATPRFISCTVISSHSAETIPASSGPPKIQSTAETERPRSKAMRTTGGLWGRWPWS